MRKKSLIALTCECVVLSKTRMTILVDGVTNKIKSLNQKPGVGGSARSDVREQFVRKPSSRTTIPTY